MTRKLPLRQASLQAEHRRTFSSHLVQSLLVLLGITIAVHHLLLTSPILQAMMGSSSGLDNELDAPQKQSNRALDITSELSLESLSGNIGHSSHLSAAEKEHLLNAVKMLAQQKKNGGNDKQQPNDDEETVKTSVTATSVVANVSSAEVITTLKPTSPYA